MTGTSILQVELASIYRAVRRNVDDICSQVETLRLLANSISNSVAHLPKDAEAEALRQAVTTARTSALTILIHAASIVTRCGSLETIAEVHDLQEMGS